MCASTRASIVIMCWSSRLQVGRKARAASPGHAARASPPPGPDGVIFLCGHPPMADALEATLKGIGYSEQAIIFP